MSKFTELFEGQELSEGFKDQAEAIMQTAINEAVEAKTTEIEEAKETFITEKTKELSEAADAYLEDILKPSINEKADEYITYAVTKWKEDNKLQLESGAKVEIAESFMKGLKELFEAHNVSIPEGSEDALAEAEKKVEATEAKLNEAIEHGIKLTKEVEKMVVGDGSEEGVTQGPLINDAAVEKVQGLVQDALDKGASVATGGEQHELGGRFYAPTVLTNVTTDMNMTRDEIFGPVAPLYKFETDAEVVELANATEFGLASYFYSRDIGRVWRVAEALEYGMVAINSGILSTEVAPFGGVKESGTGREGSSHGVDEFTEIKYMLMGGI